MKTKYFFVLLVVALFAALAIPALARGTAKDPAQPAAQESSALIPITGASVSVPDRDAQQPSLWSGEILNSDGNSPDHVPNIQAPADTDANNERTCTSEDASEKKFSGCTE